MLKPLGDRVLIKPLEAEEITKSGIVIPKASREERDEGEIVALGTGLKEGKKYEFSVKVKDRVVFSKYAAEDYKSDDGITYKIIEENKILGIL